jgi:hypothetical protein
LSEYNGDVLSFTKYFSKQITHILKEATTMKVIQYNHTQFFRRYYIQENTHNFVSALDSNIPQLQVA